MFWIKKNMHMLLSILLLAFTTSIFGTIELYYTNHEEFWFTSTDAFIVSGILAGSCMLVLLAVGLLLKGKLRDLYSSLVFTIGAALYIQGNFANMNYGILNGEAVDWGAYPVYAVLDTIGWVWMIATGVFLCIRKQAFFHKIQKYGSLFIIAIQAVTLAVLFFTVGKEGFEKSGYYLTNEGLYEVSSKENILIFVLDAFDDDYFQELLEEEPEKYKEVFSGFTHFNNASAGGAATKIGMPAIITGEHYPGKISYSEYIAQDFDKDGLYSTLAEKNYDVRLYTEPSFVPDSAGGLVDNQISAGYTVSSYTVMAKTYFSLVLYRYLPHPLKKYFWLYTGDFDRFKTGNSKEAYIIDDAAYMKKLLDEGLVVNKKKNIFRLVHLNGAHPPYELNEYAQTVGEDNTSSVQQRKGALYIIETYINMLKDLGLYDDAAIVVMADHGQKNLAEHGILLVKEKNKTGMFSESVCPVSYFDLHPTIFNTLEIEQGQTFFDVTDEERERYFYFNDTQAGKMRVIEYAVDANLNHKDAMHKTGAVLTQDLTDVQYRYGTVLTFGAENTALGYIVSGISSTDMNEFSWTDGKECAFEFHLEKMPEENLTAAMDILTVYDKNGAQRIKIYANGTKCCARTLSEGCMLEFEIPKQTVLEDKILNLRIELPDAVSPKELLGEGNDARTLGIAIRGLQIKESMQKQEEQEKREKQEKEWKKLKALDEYSFGTDGNAGAYFIDGWHQPEEGHIWSSESAELLLRTDEVCDYNLVIEYSVFEDSGKTVLYLNDTLLGELDGSQSSVVLPVSKDLLVKDGLQVLRFQTPDAMSPVQAGKGADTRVLGACLYSMEVKQ